MPSPNTGFVAIAAGASHSLGLKADGSIVAWGSNASGQRIIPSPNTGFTAIAAGDFHSLALGLLDSDGDGINDLLDNAARHQIRIRRIRIKTASGIYVIIACRPPIGIKRIRTRMGSGMPAILISTRTESRTKPTIVRRVSIPTRRMPMGMDPETPAIYARTIP